MRVIIACLLTLIFLMLLFTLLRQMTGDSTDEVEVMYHSENNTYCYLYRNEIACVPARNP